MSENDRIFCLNLRELFLDGEYAKLEEAISDLKTAEDFLSITSVLHEQDKEDSEIILLYECLFKSFLSKNDSVNNELSDEDWHLWTEILIELSSVLWKRRNMFGRGIWHKTNAEIYKISFKNLKRKNAEEEKICCNQCSRLLQIILLNFAEYSKEEDKSEDFGLAVDVFENTIKMIGLNLYNLTYHDFIKDKIIKHSRQSQVST